MKIIHKNQTNQHQNSKTCLAIEYPLKDKDMSCAVIKLNGRYPDKGRVVNLKCKELAYVTTGSGKLVLENKTIRLKTGDMVLIEPNEKYFWEGKMTLLMPCTPAWYPKQHEEVK